MTAKMRKRGLPIPFRAVAALLLILFQIAVLITLIYLLSVKFLWVYTLFEILSILLAIVLICKKDNNYYKMSWVVFILAIPLFGGIIYLIWGGNRIFPHIKKRLRHSQRDQGMYLVQNLHVESRLEYEDLHHSRQSKYLRRESGYPVYSGTTTEYLSPGEVLFPRLLEELESAKNYIFIEFFILSEGYMWDKIQSILKRKAAEGVEVKIIFDDFGSIMRQGRDFVKELRGEGIEVSVFNPIRPSVDLFMNNRNHRKIVVIDGKVAITGGFNIGDEYINRVRMFGYWMDSGLILKGDAVTSFVVMFCNMWRFINSTDINIRRYIGYHSEPAATGFVQPYCDGPLDNRNPAKGIYMQILNTAQRYVYITSPYLILDDEMLTALCLAAKSGIDVRIITPAKWDKWYVHPVTQYYYEDLLKAGVKIYEYTPGFMHSKLFVSDDRVATVGTVNMDFRSFYFHFECGVWMCGTPSVMDIKRQFNSLLQQSSEITLSDWRRRPLGQKLKQSLFHMFAPFM